MDNISAGPEHFSIRNSNIISLCYHIRISNFLAMTLRTFRFSRNLSDSFESAKGCVSSLADYYPVDVSMLARGSNGVRYPSNTITVHKFNEIALKAALYYPIANAMEEWQSMLQPVGTSLGLGRRRWCWILLNGNDRSAYVLAATRISSFTLPGTSKHALKGELAPCASLYQKVS